MHFIDSAITPRAALIASGGMGVIRGDVRGPAATASSRRRRRRWSANLRQRIRRNRVNSGESSDSLYPTI
jgi:hypothetical protein